MTSIDFNKSIIHIGLPKTASTNMQIYSFPEICKKINFNYRYKNDEIYEKVNLHCNKLQLDYPIHEINLPNKTLISNENLAGWDPYDYTTFAKKNFQTFGDNINILITLREPKSFLSSIYVQRCISSGHIISPEKFFLTDKVYSKEINQPKFAIEKFSYNKIINSYNKYFSNVEVIFYEDIFDKKYFKKNFNIDLTEDLTNDKQKHIFKKRLSRRSVKFLFYIEKCLNFFGLALHKSSIATENFENFLHYKYRNKSGQKKIFNWNEFLRTKVDRFFKDDKFELDFDKLDFIKIDELTEEYNILKKDNEN